MVSCDTREDWFEKNSDGPDLIVTINGKTDTIFKGESRSIIVDLHSKWIDRKVMYTDTVTLTIMGGNENAIVPMRRIHFEGLQLRMSDHYQSEANVVNAMVSHYYGVPTSGEVYFENDTSAVLLEVQKGQIWADDEFQNREYYNIIVNIYGPIPPTPFLQIEKLEENSEYRLSLDMSFDKDGKVSKYEWCIDGNIVSYSITDNRFEHVKGNWQSGKAAYGGTYITATTLSSINHSFQTAGEHTVYYRCMDDMGIWSMWYSEKINVE